MAIFPTVGVRSLRVLALAFLTLGLIACDGDDGAPGPQGERGPEGPPGPGLTVTPGDVDPAEGDTVTATITGVTVSSPPVVTFKLAMNGLPVVGMPASDISFNLSKYVAGTGGDPDTWQSYINRVDTDDLFGGPDRIQATTENGSAGTLEDHGDGSYTYTFAVDPTNVTTPIAVAWEPGVRHRVTFEIRTDGAGGEELEVINPIFDFVPNGSALDPAGVRRVKTETCNNCHEQLALHGGARLNTDECLVCHNAGTADAESGHELDMRIMIHKIHMGANLPSVVNGDDYCIYGFPDNGPPFLGGAANGEVCYDEIHYPQDINNCANCHNNDPNDDTPESTNWFLQPTKEACSSCHDGPRTVANPADHPFAADPLGHMLPQDNSSCDNCHSNLTAFPGPVEESHRLLIAEAAETIKLNLKSVDFTGGFGSQPTVTFNITDPTNNDTPYDLGAAGADTTFGGLRFTTAFNTADYFNFDPSGTREPAQPERQNLFSGATLNATAVGNPEMDYTIDVPAIPLDTIAIPPTAAVGTAAGNTATITLEGHPEKTVDGTLEELPVTSAHIFFAMDGGTVAERRQKVELERCNSCHEKLSLHGANRNDNVDVCLTCHSPDATDINRRPTLDDPNAATPDGKIEESINFAWMIHKIHAENGVFYGFGGPFDASVQVHYPQRISNCLACHTSDGFYPVSSDSGVRATTIITASTLGDGAGGAGNGTVDGDPTDDVNITPNAAACGACHASADARAHMENEGGSFNACEDPVTGVITVNSVAPTDPAWLDGCVPGGVTKVETCTVCHDAGSLADVARAHRLATE